jgi:ADP-heptose:LPS heptosyltransferase
VINRLLDIFSLYATLLASWIRYAFGLTPGVKLKLGEEIAPQLGKINSILLFGYMGMGDAVMFEPTLTAFLRKFPMSSIDVVVGSGSQSLAILQRIMDQNGRSFRAVFEADFKPLGRKKLKALNNQLRSKSYNACLGMYTTPIHYFIRSIESIPIRIGHSIRSQTWYKPRPNYLFNISRKVDQSIDEREPYRHFRLAQAVGIQTEGFQPVPKINIYEKDREWAVTFLREKGYLDKELIAVHLGVSKAMQWKKWSDERYAKVLQNLALPNRHFLFFGSADELREIEIAREGIKDQSSVFAGTLDVMQVGAIISCCKLVIGNDSGIGHLSVAIGVPTFRIFGPSDHFGCEPYNEGHIVFYKSLTCSPCMNLGLIKPGYNVLYCGHRNCLGLITVEEITSSISMLLN